MRTQLLLSLVIVLVVIVSSCSVKMEGTVGTPAGEEPAQPDPMPASDEGRPTATSSVEVLEILMGATRDEAGRIAPHTTQFTPSTPEIYVSAAMKCLDSGAIVTATMNAIRVITIDGDVIENTEVLTTEVEAPGAEATATFDFLAPDAGWPAGSYEIIISVDGAIVETLDLTVESTGV